MTTVERLDGQDEAVYQAAMALFAETPDWVTFFRETFGPAGVVRRTYTSPEALSEFERTEACAKIQQMLAELRKNNSDLPPPQEPTKVITVRIPKTIYDAIRREAHDYQTSINQLCISKLLQIIDCELIPSEFRRGEEGSNV